MAPRRIQESEKVRRGEGSIFQRKEEQTSNISTEGKKTITVTTTIAEGRRSGKVRSGSLLKNPEKVQLMSPNHSAPKATKSVLAVKDHRPGNRGE